MPRVLCVLWAVLLLVCAARQHLLMWPCPSQRMSLALKCLETEVKACGVIFCCLCISCEWWTLNGITVQVQQRSMLLSLPAKGFFASTWPMEISSLCFNMCVMILLSNLGKLESLCSGGRTYLGIPEETLTSQSRQLFWKLGGIILRLLAPLCWCGLHKFASPEPRQMAHVFDKAAIADSSAADSTGTHLFQ